MGSFFTKRGTVRLIKRTVFCRGCCCKQMLEWILFLIIKYLWWLNRLAIPHWSRASEFSQVVICVTCIVYSRTVLSCAIHSCPGESDVPAVHEMQAVLPTNCTYRVLGLSLRQARQLDQIASLHRPVHPGTAPVPSTAIKTPHCNSIFAFAKQQEIQLLCFICKSWMCLLLAF